MKESFFDFSNAPDYTGHILIWLTFFSAIAIIANIINLFKANRYLSVEHPDDLNAKRSGFERFYFSLNILKFLTILSFLSGLGLFTYEAMIATNIMEVIKHLTSQVVVLGIREALFPLLCCLWLTICLFVVYSVCRFALHWMYQRSLKSGVNGR